MDTTKTNDTQPTCPDDCVERAGIMFDEPAVLFIREDGHCWGYRRPEDDEELRRVALAAQLDCDLDEVEVSSYDEQSFEAEGQEWLVVTEEEADELWEAALDSYLEDCIYPELQGSLAHYFDDEAWKRDARHDGRGHAIGSYDGEEHDSMGFVLFRTN